MQTTNFPKTLPLLLEEQNQNVPFAKWVCQINLRVLDAELSAVATTNDARVIGLLSYDSTSIQNLGSFGKWAWY